ncbi:hypothetical protein [Desulfotruncus alcoholivorax]|uniref:hypothetical protein n=1 Tax=Desulfotruncus alcoholivorax TaxID=265477 RepID=UPI0003FEC74A|nr:hypothetical protein [Desulfotruncus alcoholivorax]
MTFDEFLKQNPNHSGAFPYSLDDFIDKYPKYQGLRYNQTFQGIFNLLTSTNSILRMMEACRLEKPALFGVYTDIETLYKPYLQELQKNKKDFDQFKQAIGSLAYFVLAPFGYESNKQRTMSGSEFFTSAMHFVFYPEKAKLKIVNRPIIVPFEVEY